MFEKIVDVIAHRMGVPNDALRMIRAARRFSGFDSTTLPAELIPMNVRQLARGVLNYAVLQVLEDWVLPYWAERQFDPGDPAFIPRSHTGVFMNVTHRDWTGIGTPDCPVEPIVDPRGMVTPFRDGWSIDVWMEISGEPCYPSRLETVHQSLVAGVPIVRTGWIFRGVEVSLISWTDGAILRHLVRLENTTQESIRCRLGVALRPFNPEGVSLLNDIHWREGSFEVGTGGTLRFSRRPDQILFGDAVRGDCAAGFTRAPVEKSEESVHCTKGIANALAVYRLLLPSTGTDMISCSCNLSGGRDTRVGLIGDGTADPHSAVESWDRVLSEGASFVTPDPDWNAYLRSSLSTVLMLCDGDTITPGPFSYHLFWFRDAAYMLGALDRFGHHRRTAQILRSFPRQQAHDGYFRSQTGEWDSNGQAVWTAWFHTLLAGSLPEASALVPSLRKGVDWIEQARHRTSNPTAASGLLPPGLSAEHLGVADFYFWDNLWACAGIQAYARLCGLLGDETGRLEVEGLFQSYWSDLERALQASAEGRPCFTAGPTRGVDHGAVGTLCAVYPLQLLTERDRGVPQSLDQLVARYFREGMFFQHFIHSGMNPYLTLQIAHAYLFLGERVKFLEILGAVLSRGTPTRTFPEAIHPCAGGGSMGDGCHGWAAAEVLSAMRDAFVYERWIGSECGVVLLAGIPEEWFSSGKSFSLLRAPVPGGVLDLEVRSLGALVDLDIRVVQRGPAPLPSCTLRLPFPCEVVNMNERWILARHGRDTVIMIGTSWPDSKLILRRLVQS